MIVVSNPYYVALMCSYIHYPTILLRAPVSPRGRLVHLTAHPSHKGCTFFPACLMQVLGQSLQSNVWLVHQEPETLLNIWGSFQWGG